MIDVLKSLANVGDRDLSCVPRAGFRRFARLHNRYLGLCVPLSALRRHRSRGFSTRLRSFKDGLHTVCVTHPPILETAAYMLAAQTSLAQTMGSNSVFLIRYDGLDRILGQ